MLVGIPRITNRPIQFSPASNFRPDGRPALIEVVAMFIRDGLRSLIAVVAALLGFAGLHAAEPMDKPLPKAEPPKATLQSLTVFPPQVSLDGPRDRQRLTVLGIYADGRQWDLSREAKYTSNAPNVVSV